MRLYHGIIGLLIICIGGPTLGQPDPFERYVGYLETIEKSDTAGYQQELSDAITEYRKAGKEGAEVYMMLAKAKLFFMGERFDESLALTEKAVELAKEEGTDSLIAYAYEEHGYRYYFLDDLHKATSYFSKAAEYFMRSGNDMHAVRLDILLGNTQFAMGQLDDAMRYYHLVLKLWRARNLGLKVAGVYNNIGLVYMDKGDSAMAMTYYDSSFAQRNALDDKLGMGQCYNNKGTLMYKLGHYDEALHFYQEGLTLRSKYSGRKSGLAESEINIGKALYRLGRIDEAREHLEWGYRAGIEFKGKEIQRRALEYLKEIHLMQGNTDTAFKYQARFYELENDLFGAQRQSEMMKLTVKNEYNKKHIQDSIAIEKERKIRHAEKQREEAEQAQRNAENLTIGIGLAAALIFVLVMFLIQRKRYNEKKKTNEIISFQRDQLQEKNREIIDSISYAQRLQEGILPSKEFLQNQLPDSFVLYIPKDIVAGDFYWVEEAFDKTYFAVADCTGHGVPGAMVSVFCSTALNQALHEQKHTNTGPLLDATREMVIDHFGRGGTALKDGMDIAMCAWDKRSMKIQFSGAHNPLWICRGKEIIEVKGDKQPVGNYTEKKAFGQHIVDLMPGDVVYLLSDGYADQFGGPKGKKFKYSTLKQLLIDMSDRPMDEQKEILQSKIFEWQGDLEQVDDICVLGVRV